MVAVAQQNRAVLTKTGIVAGRACEMRAYLSLVQGTWGTAPPPEPTPMLIGYRAKHYAVATVHRLWLKRGRVDGHVLADVWSDAWHRAGGTDGPEEDGLVWLQTYVQDNPFLGVPSRQIVGVEMSLGAVYQNRVWQARPDVVVTDDGGMLCALELSSARHPTLDRQAVETMVALDLLALRGMSLPPALRGLPQRVAVCGLLTGTEIDVTMEWREAEEVLAGIGAWLDALATGGVNASPAPDTCANCRFRLTQCAHSWLASSHPDPSRLLDELGLQPASE